jgi:hypothetical protein
MSSMMVVAWVATIGLRWIVLYGVDDKSALSR